jgi:hypothetical protein
VGGLAGFLSGIAGLLAHRVLAALGFAVVSYVGFDLAVNGLLSAAKSSWGGVTGDLAAYIAIGGFNTAASLLAGAVTARLALIGLKKLTLLG